MALKPESIEPDIILQLSDLGYSPSRISSKDAPTIVLINLGFWDKGPEIDIVL